MATGGGFGTFIACTNGTTSSQTVGVEFYNPVGGLVDDGSLTVPPTATVLFGTNPGSVTLAVDINVNPTNQVVTKGYARVLASTASGILCSAFLADTVNATPISTASLTVAKAFKQKGD
jgi:hypothetical protein